jgi:hypothetical protein
MNAQHIRANPIEKHGAWFDTIVLTAESDVHGIEPELTGTLKFIFYCPQDPSSFFGVIHPAYEFQPQRSVLTKLYRMEFTDDPVDILSSPHHFNRKDQCWVLDDDNIVSTSEPHLKVIPLSKVVSHLLMIPYHEHSKLMIGVLGQSLWADKFVTY